MRRFVVLALVIAACASNEATSTHNGSNGSDGSNAGSNTGAGGLTFAIVGDTRPASVDDTANYPTPIITKIFADIAATPAQFVVGTGDYQYASTTGSQQQPQVDLYMTARGGFTGPFYPAMGNHECTGFTDSNCGSGNPDGVTKNLTTFLTTMLGPINQTQPYYVENVSAPDGSWTAKLVFIACNAWDTAQSTWLTQQLAIATTYTFVVRHESVADMSQTKCAASQTIVNAHPLTLLVVGHTHEYSHQKTEKELINGIGGAPLTSGTNYGYTIVSRNIDGTLGVTTYDYMTHATIDSFTIKADGTAG
jgi:hypothetical protein